MNTALLLIDIQNDYFPGGAWELSHADEAAAQARLALGRFREQHRPVFHVRHINTRPGAAFFLPDTPGSEIHGAVKPLDGEPVIIKHAPDAFFQTDLHDALSRAGIRKLVVCGMMSHMCIDTSVRAARNHGYDITLLHDACATRDLSWNGKTPPQQYTKHSWRPCTGLSPTYGRPGISSRPFPHNRSLFRIIAAAIRQ